MPEQLTEARAQILAEATGTPGRYRVQLINPGWGSSGHYSPQVLAEAAGRRVFPAGLHMYADHPTATENADRPERSVRDLWAVLSSDATVGPDGGLVAEAQVFAPYRPLVEDMREAIGLSIRAAGQFQLGEADGRQGRIITSIDEAMSVDFVTSAGRGGRILELVESARGEALTETTARAQLAEARNVGQWIESRLHLALTQIADDMFGDGRLTREERIALSGAVGSGLDAFTARLEQTAPQLYERDLWADPAAMTAMEQRRRLAEAGLKDSERSSALRDAVKDTYGADKIYVWVRDYDDTLVWFERETPDGCGLFQQGYEISDGATAVLTGTPVEVVVHTTYVPVNPAGVTTTQESQEDSMATIPIEESEHARLVAEAGRVQTLESELTTTRTERDTASRALAESNARTAARPIVAGIFAESTQLPAPVAARHVETVITAAPLNDAGQLDEAALRTAATAARTAAEAEVAAIAESLGVGQVRGFGASAAPADLTEAAYDKRSASVFNRPTMKGV